MNIEPGCRLFDVLEAFPELEPQIMSISPVFKNLKNPVLRKTVGKLATLERVAQVAGMDPSRLVNTLRRAVGQDELVVGIVSPTATDIPYSAEDPEWIDGEPQFIVDGTALLRRGEVPLAQVDERIDDLEPGRYILLITDFEPVPLIDAMRKRKRRVFHKHDPTVQGRHFTFIG
ncbi:MAG: DUF1858 domain-containing protein [Bacteroidota bacterium]|nr:DUF1858 domain-containing protein [Bacteroidota bacterium]